MATQQPSQLRHPNRYLTTHDSDGNAIISHAIEPAVAINDFHGEFTASLLYTNARQPELTGDADIDAYKSYLASPPGITISEGSVCRICDLPPSCLTAMHRTASLDYGVVVEGEVELVLDSGETRHLFRGDVVVQRGTNHAWRNATPAGGWARMLYVLESSQPVKLAGGQALEADFGGIDFTEKA